MPDTAGGFAEERLAVAGEQDIVRARQRARELARYVGFGMIDQSRIATAVSELTRNVVRYATEGRGEVLIRPIPTPRGVGLEIVVSDNGPGITDIDQVIHEGFTSGRGLGLGLSGTKRLMDEMYIDSAPGRGTAVMIRKLPR
jgi:serine/threonine-protein kinase RsbT